MNQLEQLRRRPRLRLGLALGAAAAVLLAAALLLYGLIRPAKGPTEALSVPLQGAAPLRIALLSDSHLGSDKQNEGNLRAALQLLREEQVQVILFAGDLGERTGGRSAQTYRQAIEEIFQDAAIQPVLLSAMGQQDVAGAFSSAAAQRTFQRALDQAPCAHLVVNGTHFIALSADRREPSDAYTAGTLRWLEERLAQAAQETETGRPIFVLTHQPPADTVAGSGQGTGNQALRDLLAKYPGVISVSGQTQRPQVDERMLWQGQFTAIGLQGLSGVLLEPGYYDPARDLVSEDPLRPAQANAQPYLVLLRLGGSELTVERWNIKEAYREREWKLLLPLRAERFPYTPEARQTGNTPPYCPGGSAEVILFPSENGGKRLGITFPAARDDGRIAAYELEATSHFGKTVTYRCAADTFLGERASAQTVTLPLDPSLPAGTYTVKITAIDDWDARSASFYSCEATVEK
ncbi:MAG: metallophosphoesterase [Oscillospiraceae bacterium]|jgi:predicted MPP superfamily phosphohydrolase|nr:metallophosphoesterase [Oscillospiraceae bacterium]